MTEIVCQTCWKQFANITKPRHSALPFLCEVPLPDFRDAKARSVDNNGGLGNQRNSFRGRTKGDISTQNKESVSVTLSHMNTSDFFAGSTAKRDSEEKEQKESCIRKGGRLRGGSNLYAVCLRVHGWY